MVRQESAAKSSQTAASAFYGRLRRDIVLCHFYPNQPLRIEALSQRYEVGTSPVREALNRLTSEGLVTLQDKKGFRVAGVSEEDLRELTLSRCLLNEITLREAIAKGDERWEEGIVLAFHRLARTTREGADDGGVSGELWDKRHREFHDALIAACGSQRLRNIAAMMFDSAERYRNLSLQMVSERDHEQEHRAIMDATISRQTKAATELLNEHALETMRIVLASGPQVFSNNKFRKPELQSAAAAVPR
jgi:DNA-binding GntR family transcriptional regulator